jgi:hypothetical protein
MSSLKIARGCLFLAIAILIGACASQNNIPTVNQDEASPQPTSPAGRCGDGICEGPENDRNCPEDCGEEALPQSEDIPAGSNICQNPNPHRAIISEELLTWVDRIEDGGFEGGIANVVISEIPSTGWTKGDAVRSHDAAHTGDWGYLITNQEDQGVSFSLRFSMEKGEDIRITFWVRSLEGEISIQPMVSGADFSDAPPEVIYTDELVTVGSTWQQVSFELEFTRSYAFALFSLEIPPNSSIAIDDVSIEFAEWAMAEYQSDYRMVGGIPVPDAPAAPVHINFLIHIEDPAIILTNEELFQQKTAVFRELARILSNHDGFLTIQPEQDWPMASQRFDPHLLADFVEEYGVVYSTHTHGPHCTDADGILRSHADCNANRDNPNWDQSISPDEYPYVTEYVGSLKDLLSRLSGSDVTDHNGNWEFDQANRFAEVPMATWSAYKNRHDQRTFDVLINNPWRPTETDVNADVDSFLTHDPNAHMIYIPGFGQAISRHPERYLSRIGPMLSQFIYHADLERVNTFYVVLHVDHYYSRQGASDYISFDSNTREIGYSAEFEQHLADFEAVLSELIDPLVEEGYVQWTSLPEIGELFEEWEQNCNQTVSDDTQPVEQPTSADPDYEPPINVYMVLHIDPLGINVQSNQWIVSPDEYEQTYTEIDFLISEAARHGMNFTALYNGWYPMEALERGDLSQFSELLNAGHEVGSHAHRITYDPATDMWTGHVEELSIFGNPNYDPALSREIWNTAYEPVETVLNELGVADQNATMCSTALSLSDEINLMEEFGYTIAAGNRMEKGVNYFGHIVWNPWRAANIDVRGHEIAEDFTSPYISFNHYAQIGTPGGVHGVDLTVPQLQRRFLMLYLEWLSRVRTGADDKVWSFGFVFHPEDGSTHNQALAEFLTWLDSNFVGQTTPDGLVIAQYATLGEIASQFYSWEAANPGVSSFNYVNGDPYPYSHPVVPEKLEGADYLGEVNLGPDITCYQFSAGDQSIYLIWSNIGTQSIDFSAQLSGNVIVTMMNGDQSSQQPAALSISEEPMFVEAASD